MSKEAMLTAEVAVLTEMVRVLSAKVEQQEQDESMRPEIRKMYEDYFDKCFAMFAKDHEKVFEQIEQEQGGPVMTVRIWRDIHGDKTAEFRNWHTLPDGKHIFYTAPQQRKPLTDEQRRKIASQAAENDWHDYEVIDAVEAAHGITEEKNK
jgi:hypothetical protein